MARCMLLDANMDKKFWGEAVSTANFLQNRLPIRATEKTPHELWLNEKTYVKNLHVFVCKALVHVPKEHRKKLDAKSEEYIFIRNIEESKAYRFLNAATGALKISLDAVFLDSNQVSADVTSEIEYIFAKNNTQETSIEESDSEDESSHSSAEEEIPATTCKQKYIKKSQ